MHKGREAGALAQVLARSREVACVPISEHHTHLVENVRHWVAENNNEDGADEHLLAARPQYVRLLRRGVLVHQLLRHLLLLLLILGRRLLLLHGKLL